MPQKLFLAERHRALLATNVPDSEVWAYGSRVKDDAHDGSDLDIVLRNPRALEQSCAGRVDLIEALEASMLPMLVDVSDWSDLPRWLREDIANSHIVLREASR